MLNQKNLKKTQNLKIITYNIHKGKSFLLRKNILKEINELIHDKTYDFIFLQEVRDFHEKDYKKHQALQTDILSNGLYESFYGKNRTYKKGHHGNAVLTNHKVIKERNFDISVNKLESRGFFVLTVEINGYYLNIACTHLNLRKKDRLKQINLIDKIIEENYKDEPFIFAGDFNDFDKGVEKSLKELDFHSIAEVKTFPHIFPLFHLDKVFVKNIFVKQVQSHSLKNLKSIIMSDHLPIEVNLSIVI